MAVAGDGRAAIVYSRWGDLYRRRYYIDGKRVSDDAFHRIMGVTLPLAGTKTTTSTCYGFRTEWRFVRVPDTHRRRGDVRG